MDHDSAVKSSFSFMLSASITSKSAPKATRLSCKPTRVVSRLLLISSCFPVKVSKSVPNLVNCSIWFPMTSLIVFNSEARVAFWLSASSKTPLNCEIFSSRPLIRSSMAGITVVCNSATCSPMLETLSSMRLEISIFPSDGMLGRNCCGTKRIRATPTPPAISPKTMALKIRPAILSIHLFNLLSLFDCLPFPGCSGGDSAIISAISSPSSFLSDVLSDIALSCWHH